MSRNTLSPERRGQFRFHMAAFIAGLKQHFPGHLFVTHHLAMHLPDFMELFSTVRHWWCFPVERLIGKLQRVPINHKIGVHLHNFIGCEMALNYL